MKLTKQQNRALAAAMRGCGDTSLDHWQTAKATVGSALDLGDDFDAIIERLYGAVSHETSKPARQASTAKPDHQGLWDAAHAAGHAAATAVTPHAMLVGTPKNLMGSLMGGDDGGFDPEKPVYYESEGVCGFAWINWKGNTSWGRWTAKTDRSRKDSYYGGQTYWVSDYGQSMERKEAYARAFAAVLTEHGIDCTPMSRMD